jgi:hypothetical protein
MPIAGQIADQAEQFVRGGHLVNVGRSCTGIIAADDERIDRFSAGIASATSGE